MNRSWCTLVLLAVAAHADPSLPIASGHYRFGLKDAEFPRFKALPVIVTIDGTHIHVVSASTQLTGDFPLGQGIAEGTLMWNVTTRQWIIGETDSDRTNKEVGGCSGGPPTIDFAKREIWSC